MNDKKRVVCFYRVSTKKQVIDDDIPLQRNSCKEFIKKHLDWEFVGEYCEKGVSGYKVKAEDREILEQLRADALKNKFDIVLLFMFDRLGRIEEETPFVLQWFVEQGIEMWSVVEGQRTLYNHVDNLLNYITFWQASGESKKTQQRILAAKQQMINEGKYLGCSAPYGYKHLGTGEHNNKGREIMKLVIDDRESEIVKEIFDLVIVKGYGARRIARELNENRIPTKKGTTLWASPTIMGILKNSVYKGYFTYGRKKCDQNKRKYVNQSECIISKIRHEDLVIISEKKWQEVQNIISVRAGKIGGNIPRQTNSPLLFTGFIYCGNCGSRLTLHYSYIHSIDERGNEIKKRKEYYVCYASENGQKTCKRKYYAANIIEGVVLEEIYLYLDKLNTSDLINEVNKYQIENQKKTLKQVWSKEDQIRLLEKNLVSLKNEVVKILRGDSDFSKELIGKMIIEEEEKLQIATDDLNNLRKIVDIMKEEKKEFKNLKSLTPTWRDEFRKADLETQKMLLSRIIERVEVKEGEVHLKLKLKLEEFMSEKV